MIEVIMGRGGTNPNHYGNMFVGRGNIFPNGILVVVFNAVGAVLSARSVNFHSWVMDAYVTTVNMVADSGVPGHDTVHGYGPANVDVVAW